MVDTKYGSRRFLIFFVFLAGFVQATDGLADHGINAYTITAGVSGNVLPKQAMNGQGFQVRTNANAMANEHVTFPLPNGIAKVAKRKRMIVNQRGQTWVGKFEGEVGGTVILRRRKGIVSGIIDDGENLYELVRGNSGKTILFQVDR